ncbi:MAG: hypothetical protein J7M25_11530 [Deltaproteobacteria bacterium]|nr:hypothetical protein [Deltaproteobacteria bacterium]
MSSASWNNFFDQFGAFFLHHAQNELATGALQILQPADATPVQSVLPFGYWNMDMSMEPGFSIRGKSAERVVEIWFP